MKGSSSISSAWGQPTFLLLDRPRRDFVLFCLTAPAASSPPGLLAYEADTALKRLAKDAAISIPYEIEQIQDLIQCEHSPDSGVFYLSLSYYGNLLRIFTSRHFNYWKSKLDKIEACAAREAWVKDIYSHRNLATASLKNKIELEYGEVVSGEKPNSESVDIKYVYNHFITKFEEARSDKYITTWYKEAKIIKDLLKTLDKEDLCSRIDGFMSNQWFKDNSKLDISTFRNNINRFPPTSTPSTKIDAYWDIVNQQRGD